MEHLKKIEPKRVTFKRENLTLVGNLYAPVDFDKSQTYPAVVVGGSLTSVKEQMGGRYARKMAENGIVALALDYSHYGESEGQPRQYENPDEKAKDLQAAVQFLNSLDYVGKVGALGICTSGGTVAYLAAEDKNVKAIATVAAWLPTQDALPLLYGSKENVDKLRANGRKALAKYENEKTVELIPAYHNEDQTASHVEPMEYYMDTSRGGGVKEWKNELAVMSWEPWLNFSPIERADSISIPTMVVHSDNSALPDNAKLFYEKLQGEKELVWLEGNHFDFYDQPKQVNEAVAHLSTFFNNTLK